MTNYEFFNDKKTQYLSYLGKQIKVLENEISDYFTNDRDIKLELLIGDDLPKVKEEIDSHINKIKNNFNDFDLYDIDISKAEEIAGDYNKLHNYFEYVVKRMEEVESEKMIEVNGGNQTS